MVNEFAHNAYVNKSDGLEMNLRVSKGYLFYCLFRTTLAATVKKKKVTIIGTRVRVEKRKKFSRRNILLIGTISRWVTSFKKMKTNLTF